MIYCLDYIPGYFEQNRQYWLASPSTLNRSDDIYVANYATRHERNRIALIFVLASSLYNYLSWNLTVRLAVSRAKNMSRRDTLGGLHSTHHRNLASFFARLLFAYHKYRDQILCTSVRRSHWHCHQVDYHFSNFLYRALSRLKGSPYCDACLILPQLHTVRMFPLFYFHSAGRLRFKLKTVSRVQQHLDPSTYISSYKSRLINFSSRRYVRRHEMCKSIQKERTNIEGD